MLTYNISSSDTIAVYARQTINCGQNKCTLVRPCIAKHNYTFLCYAFNYLQRFSECSFMLCLKPVTKG